MRQKRSRRPEWMVTFGLMLIFATWYACRYLLPGEPPLAGAGRPGTDWFFVVRVPEVPKDDTGIEAHRKRLASWLDESRAAGFRPMLMSEVVTRLRDGFPLPEKAVVFAFTHSFRPTVEALRPVFEERGATALWIADGEWLRDSDQHLVSPHEWRLMRRSRQWDLATHGAATRTFTLDGAGAHALTFADDSGRWGLNRGSELPNLRYLGAQRSWTGRQLVDRLQSEVPIQSATRLTAVRMFQWQLGVPVYDAATPPSFALSSPPWRRSGAVRWLGAEAAEDAALRLKTEELIGELWVGLRMQPDGSGVKVGFTEDRWVVDLTVDGRDRRLCAVSWPRAKKRAFEAVIVWRGEELTVRAGGVSRKVKVARAKRWRGPLDMITYHKIRGVAVARGLTVLLVPTPRLPLVRPGMVTSAP